MKCFFAGLATTLVMLVVSVNLEEFFGNRQPSCWAASLCAGIVVGCTVKIVSEIRKISVQNAAEYDK